MTTIKISTLANEFSMDPKSVIKILADGGLTAKRKNSSVDEDKARSLLGDSNETSPIKSFTGDYCWLSNFYSSEVILYDEKYPTVEHAFQASKTSNKSEREHIRTMTKAGQAKKAGRRVLLRPDWEDIKIDNMSALLTQKFTDPRLKKLLLETGDAELIEGNRWGDTFWGMCNGRGKNTLGKLLMGIREELKTRKNVINFKDARANKTPSKAQTKAPAKAAKAPKTEGTATERKLVAFYDKYPHVVIGSVREPNADDKKALGARCHGKVCDIKCVDSGEKRIINTQDAFQVKRTEESQLKYLRYRRAERRAEKKARKVVQNG